MKQTKRKFSLSLVLCTVLIAVMALFTTACSDNSQHYEVEPSENDNEASPTTVLGEGAITFYFSVVDDNKKETRYEIHTDHTTVGEALLSLGLISGDNGTYGLYVKTVDGITADYDSDGCYWAFYVDENFAPSGVDMTEITENGSYSFRITR